MSEEFNMDGRRRKASQLLSTKGFMSLAELAQELKVSESTVRRDLDLLEEKEQIKRTRGGAVYVGDPQASRLGFDDRQTTAVDEKRAIARAVAELIPPGQAIILDGGTTCLEVARAISGRHLSVITNSVPIAALLSAEPATEVTLIGGYLYPRTGVALGAMAEQHLSMLHAAQLIVSCAGLTAEAAFNANQMMVDSERRMMDIADEVILAVDHTKLGKRSVVHMVDLDRFDRIVTDAGCDDAARDWLEASPADVTYAELEFAVAQGQPSGTGPGPGGSQAERQP